jgi:hypothetical protein
MDLVITPLAYCLVVLIVVLAVGLPVRIGARIVGAQRDGLMRCFGAALLGSLLGSVVSWFTGWRLLVGPVVSAFIYMLFLETTFLRGLVIGVIQTLILRAVVILLALTFLRAYLGPLL